MIEGKRDNVGHHVGILNKCSYGRDVHLLRYLDMNALKKEAETLEKGIDTVKDLSKGGSIN